MSGLTLAQRVTAIHAALADVPHAFGGALALAYAAEPRATIDIDLNVFVSVDAVEDVFGPLAGLGVDVADPALATTARCDGQVRIWWEATPIDLFFAYDPFHDAARRACREVPFAEGTIPILAPEHLIVCKVVYNRAKDWVDIDAMLDALVLVDAAEVLRWVARIAGDEDARFRRIVALLTR